MVVLLVLDGLPFILVFGQCHGCTNGEAQDCTNVRTVLLCDHSLTAFFGIFRIVLDQPAQCSKARQTSTDRAAELTAVPTMIFRIELSTCCVSRCSSTRLSESIFESSEEY